MISTESQPSISKRARKALVLASSTRAASITTSLPSPCLADNAVLRPSLRTFFCSENEWLRTTGPKILAPPRNCGEPFGLVGPGAAFRQLPIDNSGEEVATDGEAEHLVSEFDVTDLLIVEIAHSQLH